MELFTAVVEIGERIRAKGSLAAGGFCNLAKMAQIDELAEDASSQQRVLHQQKANEKVSL